MRKNNRNSFGGGDHFPDANNNGLNNANAFNINNINQNLNSMNLGIQNTQSSNRNIQKASIQNRSNSINGSVKQELQPVQQEQNITLDNINSELDENMNSMIILMNRRNWLVKTKRIKMIEEFDTKRAQLAQLSLTQLLQEASLLNYNSDSSIVLEFLRKSSITPEMQKIARSITSGIKPEAIERRQLESSRSQDFWNTNKTFENEIDNLLQKLKYLDQELEKGNADVHDVCRRLDSIEDNMRDLLIQKSDENVKRAEPLFQNKQIQHNILKQLLVTRTQLKDEKVKVIYSIIKLLSQLKQLRQERINDLGAIFGGDGLPDQNIKINYYADFVDQLEIVAKIKEEMQQIESLEQEMDKEIENCSKNIEDLFSEFVKRSSDEAKVFSDLGDVMAKKTGLFSIVEYFVSFSNISGAEAMDLKELLRQLKESIVFMKPLIEEDQAIKAGLKKTSDTTNTFSNILRAIENEKERRRELLRVMENCQRLKDEEEIRHEGLREIELDISKKQHQKKHLEEDLDNILADADLEQFKKLGAAIKNHENQVNQLFGKSQSIQAETQEIQKEVTFQQDGSFLNLMNLVKSEYDDIVKEVLPNNILSSYDFREAKDIRIVKNYLMKTFKRLGIHIEEQQM